MRLLSIVLVLFVAFPTLVVTDMSQNIDVASKIDAFDGDRDNQTMCSSFVRIEYAVEGSKKAGLSDLPAVAEILVEAHQETIKYADLSTFHTVLESIELKNVNLQPEDNDGSSNILSVIWKASGRGPSCDNLSMDDESDGRNDTQNNKSVSLFPIVNEFLVVYDKKVAALQLNGIIRVLDMEEQGLQTTQFKDRRQQPTRRKENKRNATPPARNGKSKGKGIHLVDDDHNNYDESQKVSRRMQRRSGKGTDPPTFFPSESPSVSPSNAPSSSPSVLPSTSPSVTPSVVPSISPSDAPSAAPSLTPSFSPSDVPSVFPSLFPSVFPSLAPSSSPSFEPSESPSSTPTISPSAAPSPSPSNSPTQSPTCPNRAAVGDFTGTFSSFFRALYQIISDSEVEFEEGVSALVTAYNRVAEDYAAEIFLQEAFVFDGRRGRRLTFEEAEADRRERQTQNQLRRDGGRQLLEPVPNLAIEVTGFCSGCEQQFTFSNQVVGRRISFEPPGESNVGANAGTRPISTVTRAPFTPPTNAPVVLPTNAPTPRPTRPPTPRPTPAPQASVVSQEEVFCPLPGLPTAEMVRVEYNRVLRETRNRAIGNCDGLAEISRPRTRTSKSKSKRRRTERVRNRGLERGYR